MPYIGSSPSNGVRRVHTYTATASQTTFTGASSEGITLSYADTNYIDVFQNGVLLGNADYTSTSGTSVVLAQGASADDLIVIVVYDVFSVADTVSKTNGGSFDSAVTMSNNLTVSGAFTSNGIDDNADAPAITIDSSENVGIGITGPTVKLDIVDDGVQLRLANSTTGTGTSDGSRIQLSGNDLLLVNRESANMQFYTADTERMRILSSGGITFNGDTATANALDDYEEGTASLSTGTGSVTIIYATYTKIGRLVTVRCGMYNFTDRTTAQPIQINGLPFTSSSTNQSASGVLHRYFNGGGDQVVTYIGTSSNRISLYQNTANGNYQEVNHNHLSSTSSAVYLTVSYETA